MNELSKLPLIDKMAFYGSRCDYLTREANKLPFDYEDLYDIQNQFLNEEFDSENYRLVLKPLDKLTDNQVKEVGYDNKEQVIAAVESGSISIERFVKLCGMEYDCFDFLESGNAVTPWQ